MPKGGPRRQTRVSLGKRSLSTGSWSAVATLEGSGWDMRSPERPHRTTSTLAAALS